MDITTRQFLADREAKIIQQMKELRDELRELRAIKGAIIARDNPDIADRVSGTLTFQDMIVEVLNTHPENGAEALEILDLIERKFQKKILRSSISPQLSRLKSKGVLQLNNSIWSLAPIYKAQNHEELKVKDKENPSEGVLEDMF